MRMLILLAAVLTMVFAACGGDDDEGGGGASTSSGGGGGASVALASPQDGSLKFDKTELTAQAGEVTIDYDNPSSTPHAVEIEGEGKSETITGGKTSVTADLEAGEYTFFCPVGNHRDGGMEGTLTVE